VTKSSGEDGRLVRLTKICLALPEATRECHGAHASFSVRKKKFAYYLHDHHGDGIVSVCFKTEPGENEILIAAEARRFYRPAYIGPRGWVGLRLDVGKVDWDEVADFVTDSFRRTAPKSLAARVPPAPF
jgi:predicted DNA-binding protein (MmcQ/YjbR family)